MNKFVTFNFDSNFYRTQVPTNQYGNRVNPQSIRNLFVYFMLFNAHYL